MIDSLLTLQADSFLKYGLRSYEDGVPYNFLEAVEPKLGALLDDIAQWNAEYSRYVSLSTPQELNEVKYMLIELDNQGVVLVDRLGAFIMNVGENTSDVRIYYFSFLKRAFIAYRDQNSIHML